MKKTAKTMAHIILSAGFLLANLFDRYSGIVIASFAAAEKLLSLLATSNQLRIVPAARPIPIHIFPKPKARILPGNPISNHPLISDA